LSAVRLPGAGFDAARLAAVVAAALGAWLACGQSLRWESDVEAGVRRAQREQRPILFYLLDRSRRDDRDLRQRQAAVFRDRRVVKMAQRFVLVRLAIDRHPDLRRRWGLGPNADRVVVFASPDGDALLRTGIGAAESFLGDMRRALAEFAWRLWRTRLRAVLRDAQASAKQKLTALQRVRNLRIREAEADLIALIQSDSTEEAVRQAGYRTLAVLSTPRGIEALLEAAREDEQAAEALRLCTPVGAEIMLDRVEPGDEHLRRLVYEAAVRICKIDARKSERFWETADERARLRELRRVRALVRRAAMRYRMQNPPPD